MFVFVMDLYVCVVGFWYVHTLSNMWDTSLNNQAQMFVTSV